MGCILTSQRWSLLTQELTVLWMYPTVSLSLVSDIFYPEDDRKMDHFHHIETCVSSASCLCSCHCIIKLPVWHGSQYISLQTAGQLLYFSLNPSFLCLLVCFSLLSSHCWCAFLCFFSSCDGRGSKTTTRLVIGPKYNELRDWHHGVSARTLNVQ